MNLISYEKASDIALNWTKAQPPMVIALIDDSCQACNEYLELAAPVIEEYGFLHYHVNLTNTRIAFPPAYIPQTYWYFVENQKPMIKRGAPPSKDMLIATLDKILRIYRGETTIEQEF